MPILIANAARLAMEVSAEAFKPPPLIDFKVWAAQNIVFSGGGAAIEGPYNRDLFPFYDEILDALGPEDPCRTVTFAKSAQIGATTLSNIFLMAAMALDPCHFLYVHPTEDNAKRWSKLKFAEMVKSTPAMASVFPLRTRDQSETVLYKETADGRGALLASGANSPASLSQISMRRQVQDDLSKWEINAAGDPETQANSRSRAFEFGKIFKISTPLVQPGCRITHNFEQGSRERWHIPCPHCGVFQVLTFDNFKETIEPDAPEHAHFTCVECHEPIREHHRPAFNRQGRWVAENEAAKRYHRSFHLWSAYSPLQSFETIAREWLAASGKPDLEKVFLNDTVGVAFNAVGEAPPWEALHRRSEAATRPRGVVPADGVLVTIGVDCQQAYLKWQCVAWPRDGRRFVVDEGMIGGNIADEYARKDLDALLQREWLHASGRLIRADKLAIDGNAYTPDVWEWVRRKPQSRVVMVRGVGGEDKVNLFEKVSREVDRAGRKIPWSKRFYNFATSVMKLTLYRNLAVADPILPGFVDFPHGLPPEYFEELTAEKRVMKRNKTGFPVFEWRLDEGRRNEALDTMNQAETAAHIAGLRTMPQALWDHLVAERCLPAPDRQLDLEDLPLLARLPSLAVGSPTPSPDTKTGVEGAAHRATATPPESRPRGLAERMADLARRRNG